MSTRITIRVRISVRIKVGDRGGVIRSQFSARKLLKMWCRHFGPPWCSWFFNAQNKNKNKLKNTGPQRYPGVLHRQGADNVTC